MRQRIDAFLRTDVSLRVLLGLALAIAAALLFGWIAEEMLESDTLRFDARVRAAVHTWAGPRFTLAMKAASAAGAPLPAGLLAAGAFCLFWFAKRRRDAILIIITIAGASVVGWVLKISFHRTRPTPYFGLAPPGTFSFPSGHAITSFCFYVILAHVLGAMVKAKAARLLIWLVGTLMFVVIGFSRIYLGVHYPSDVIAGYAAGLVWVITVLLAEKLVRRRQARA
jgi:membrane-associated phospholipid phosphatase